MRPSPAGIVQPERRGPVEGAETIGIDRSPEKQPGVPMESEPSDVEEVSGRPLVRQEGDRGRKLHRKALDGPTAVFGTAQPRSGLSGGMRKVAYEVPEHRMRHWLLLMLADRLDATEHRLGGALAYPLEKTGARDAADRVRERPFLTAGTALAGAWLVRRALRHGSST